MMLVGTASRCSCSITDMLSQTVTCIRVCPQVWKFPKGINARDLKARLAESRQAETLGLSEEVPPPEGAPFSSISMPAEKGLPAVQLGSKGKLRQSLLVPGRESPRWLSLQQVTCSIVRLVCI